MKLVYDPLSLTQQLVQIPSVSPDSGEALDCVQAHLEPLGFTCHRQSFEDQGSYQVPNLYARWGSQSPNFCFAGHTDVVPPGDDDLWKYPPFSGVIANDFLHGRGSADMKGALATFIVAAKEYLESAHPQGSISLLITGDEEAEALNGTKRALEWILAKGEQLDGCLIGEASCETELGDTLKVGRRGSLSGTIIVKGTQGHVAYPDLADNPISRLISILSTLNQKVLDDGNDLFQPSNFEITSIDVGNTARNVIPAQVMAHFNIRYNPLQSLEDLQTWIEKSCAAHTESYDLYWANKGLPFYTEPCRLRDVVTQAVEVVTSLKPKPSTGGGTSDGRFIHTHCPVVEFGVCNATIHQANESVPVRDLQLLKEVYKETLRLYFSGL